MCACQRLKILAERRMRSSLTRRIMRIACSAPEREEEVATSEGRGMESSAALMNFSTTATTTSTGTAVTTSSGIQLEA